MKVAKDARSTYTPNKIYFHSWDSRFGRLTRIQCRWFIVCATSHAITKNYIFEKNCVGQYPYVYINLLSRLHVYQSKSNA